KCIFFGDPDFAGDVDRGAAERVFAGVGVAFGERRAVGGEDRGPRGELDFAFEVLAAPQPGEDQARVPGDATVCVGQVEVALEFAEGDGGGLERHRDDGRAAACAR